MNIQQADQEYIRCPLCGEDQTRSLFVSRDRLMTISGDFQVVQCEDCDLVYINPRPTFAALARYYPADLPINNLKPVRENGRLKEKAFVALTNLYGYYRARWIENHVVPLNQATRVLDIGCGSASFLYYLKTRRGCQTSGVDISPTVVQYVRDRLDIPIYEGVLAEADFEENSFDLITMWHYIEHELEPAPALHRARALLKSDCYLVLETPNIASPVAMLFRNRWSQVHPRHQILYSLETMDKMLARCGFRIIKAFRAPLAFSFGVSTLFALGFEGIGKRDSFSVKNLAASALLLGLAPVNILVNLFTPECIRVVAQRRT
ncbi:MAG: class I SAM-dependent methyltransferase [Acidobacteria bacterium]|nr:class I SAM-dependent methyltransferase [Acidobacteriota bacterium]